MPAFVHPKSLFDYVGSWRHAAEDGAIEVYTKHVTRNLVLQGFALAAFLYLFRHTFATVIAILVIVIIAVPRTLAEARRALIFTSTEIIYRPPLGPPRHVGLKKIESLTRSKVLTSYLLRPVPRPGVVLKLSNGATEAWPLDFEDEGRILERLAVLTEKPIAG